MEIATILVQALVLGAVASGLAHLILGSWPWRSFVAWWLALSLVAWAGLAGPLKLG